jgi:hypothetical protein
VNREQAKLLVEYENSGRIHADLVFRGDDETAQKFLDAQDEYFRQLKEKTEEGETTDTGDEDGEGFDIVQYANDIINGKVPAYLPETEVSSDE